MALSHEEDRAQHQAWIKFYEEWHVDDHIPDDEDV